MKMAGWVSVCLLLAGPMPAFAMQTPFDSRLARAGFFDISAHNPLPGRQLSAEALFRMAKAFRYAPDAAQDLWQSPEETLRRRSGDCEDKALWLYRELKRNGHRDIHLAVGRFRPSDPSLHVWVLYSSPSGDTYILDPTAQRKPWETSRFPQENYQALYLY